MPKIVAGWLEGVRQVPTARFNRRPAGTDITLIVIHCIALPPCHFGGPHVDEIFLGRLDPTAHPYFKLAAAVECSTHFFINRTGLITQYVSCLDRAWHAGRSAYRGRPECNDYSVGIELEGCEYCAYTKEQYDSLKVCVAALRQAYPGIGDKITAHSTIAPGRKTDPGPYFDFSQLGCNGN